MPSIHASSTSVLASDPRTQERARVVEAWCSELQVMGSELQVMGHGKACA